MLPIIVDITKTPIIVVGAGEAAQRRVDLLIEAGAGKVSIFTGDDPPPAASNPPYQHFSRWPEPEEIARARIMFLAGIAQPEYTRLAEIARAAGVLVNTEDVAKLCDFHMPAIVRRGALLLCVSTGGKSPGLAVRIKKELEKLFPAVWSDRIAELSLKRDQWRIGAASYKELSGQTNAHIDREGWLK